MQQTENLKLNLIETGDPISPAPINENAQKIEAALTSEVETRQAETADLDQRVTTLELKKLVFGSYIGNGISNHIIALGFTPIAVLIRHANFTSNPIALLLAEQQENTRYAVVVDNGFNVHSGSETSFNVKGYSYNYIAFG